MPNWCEHTLTITGPEAERKRFMAECFTTAAEKPHFDFDKLIPQPEHIKTSTDGGGEERDGGFRFPDWYEWNCQNWGTKWNAADTKVTTVGNGSGAITLHFDTAWSIPWPIYETLAERFPLLTIEGEIVELMMEFGGHIRCHGGDIEYEDKSDQIKADMAELHAKLAREGAEEFYADLLKFLSDQPCGIKPGTIGECKARIAKQLVQEEPGLIMPERQDEFLDRVKAIYERDHAIVVTLSDEEIASVRKLADRG